MEYIRVYLSFFNSRKTKKLVRKCGHEGVVCLQKLWIYATQNKQDGVIDLTEEDIELEVDWCGDNNKLVDGLLESGYLAKNSDGKYELSNWLENNPHLDPEAVAKRRERAAKGGKAKARKAVEISTYKQDNPAYKQQPSKKSLLSPANLKEPNIKEPNITKTNKDKSAKRDNIPYEDILNDLNDRAGTAYLATTDATIIHINNAWDFVMKHPTYKDDPISAFFLVNELKVKECKDDPEQRKWLKPSVIYRMGPKNNNFENNLNQPKQQTDEEKYGRWGKRIIT